MPSCCYSELNYNKNKPQATVQIHDAYTDTETGITIYYKINTTRNVQLRNADTDLTETDITIYYKNAYTDTETGIAIYYKNIPQAGNCTV